jgi:hypothetical protein
MALLARFRQAAHCRIRRAIGGVRRIFFSGASFLQKNDPIDKEDDLPQIAGVPGAIGEPRRFEQQLAPRHQTLKRHDWVVGSRSRRLT